MMPRINEIMRFHGFMIYNAKYNNNLDCIGYHIVYRTVNSSRDSLRHYSKKNILGRITSKGLTDEISRII